MRYKLLATLLCLVSFSSWGDQVSSITVFHAKDSLVLNDLSFLDRNIPIQVYKVDALNNANQMISDAVYSRVPKYPKGDKDPVENFREGFSQLLNSPDWHAIDAELQNGAQSVEFIARYKIKKVPAIVFNETDVVYGVRSMAEAMRLYNLHGGKQ